MIRADCPNIYTVPHFLIPKYEKRFFILFFFFLFRSIWSWVATWKTRLKMSNLSRNCSVSCLICQAARHLGCANGRSSYHSSVKRFRYGFQTKGQLFDTIITQSYPFILCFALQYVFCIGGIELRKLLGKIDFLNVPYFCRINFGHYILPLSLKTTHQLGR